MGIGQETSARMAPQEKVCHGMAKVCECTGKRPWQTFWRGTAYILNTQYPAEKSAMGRSPIHSHNSRHSWQTFGRLRPECARLLRKRPPSRFQHARSNSPFACDRASIKQERETALGPAEIRPRRDSKPQKRHQKWHQFRAQKMATILFTKPSHGTIFRPRKWAQNGRLVCDLLAAEFAAHGAKSAASGSEVAFRDESQINRLPNAKSHKSIALFAN